jgi:Uncharacterised nucleotidyltransferase
MSPDDRPSAPLSGPCVPVDLPGGRRGFEVRNVAGGLPASSSDRQDRVRGVVRRLVAEEALIEVVGRLSERGVRPLVLKGAAFAHWLYESPDERLYVDLDLLVDPELIELAESVLAEFGFARADSGWHEHERSLHHSVWAGGRPFRVELHHTMHLFGAAPALVWRLLSANASTIELGGVSVAVPAEAASAVIVAVHAALHGVGTERPMRDLRLSLARVPEPVWREAAAMADALGALDAFACGLGLDPRGRALVEALGLDARASRYLRLRASTAPDTAIGIERLAATRGLGPRVLLVARELVPSRRFMLAYYPQARRGRWGLPVAYLQRPFRLAGKLPRGLLAWSRSSSWWPA